MSADGEDGGMDVMRPIKDGQGATQRSLNVSFRHLQSSPLFPLDPAVQKLQGLIGRVLRVNMTDGRTVIGELASLDWMKNVLLTNAYLAHIRVPERKNNTEKGDINPGSYSTRALGAVIIQFKWIVKIFLAHYIKTEATPPSPPEEVLSTK